jgi:hypothetical protein
VGRHGDADRAHVAFERRDLALRQLEVVDPPFARGPQDVVVDVGHVLDVIDVDTLRAQVPDQHVELRVQEGVPEVRGVVGRDAAHVDAHPRAQGQLARQSRPLVVEAHASFARHATAA